jgi:cytoskeletal protein CcmA (bactofilin family)
MWRKPNENNQSSKPPAGPVSGPTIHNDRLKTEGFQTQAPAMPAPSAPSFQSGPAPVSSSVSKITSGLKIQGDLSGSSDLYIDGEVQGKIRLDRARVTVGPNGRVQADIEAREIVVEGNVQGNLKAGESARFAASSTVTGSIVSPRLGIDDGAKLRGKIETVRAAKPGKSTANETAPETEDVPAVASGVRSE